MAERFERLYELPRNLYTEGSPVIISAGVLLKDTQSSNVVAQIKFQSVAEKTIRALKLSLAAYDVSGKALQGVPDYQYLELNITIGEDFGSNKAIVMPVAVTRSFKIEAVTVIFKDGTLWETADPFETLPQSQLLDFDNAEVEKQYRIATNASAKYTPCTDKDLWQCACGSWNRMSSCSHCRITKDKVFSAFNISVLTEQTNSRLAAEAEEIRIAAEKEAKRKEDQAAAKKAALKKAKMLAAITIPIAILVLIFTLWLYPDVIQPNSEYKAAQALLADGKYDDAIAAFNELGEYKDSAVMVSESLYQKAVSLLGEQKYDDSIVIFGRLDGYKDCTGRIKEAKYKKALHLAELGSIEDAIAILKTLNGYADSNSNLEMLSYQYASNLLEQGNYDEAKVIYQSIESYEDSSNMVLECDYLKATVLFDEGKYEDAIELFLQISGYKDADNQVLDCKYQLALTKMENSHYSDAIELLGDLGNYKDASEQLVEAKYQLAKQYASNSSYESATALFSEIGNYKDANTYIQLISETKSMVYQTHDNFQYWYLWVQVVVDIDNCSLKVLAQEARSNDLVNIGERKYSIDYLWRFEEWKQENGKYIMVFEGSNPIEDRKSYREWTVGANWSTIRSQSMVYTGEILGDPGEYVDNYTRITDEEVLQKLIERFSSYRGN